MFAYPSPFMRWVFAQGMHHVRFVIDSYCSAHPTGALRLSCAVPQQVRNMCFSSCFFLLFFFSPSVYLHMFLDENATWWKSIKDGKCIRNENQRSPDLYRAREAESELLNITIKLNVTNFQRIYKKKFWWKPEFEPGCCSPSVTTWNVLVLDRGQLR